MEKKYNARKGTYWNAINLYTRRYDKQLKGPWTYAIKHPLTKFLLTQWILCYRRLSQRNFPNWFTNENLHCMNNGHKWISLFGEIILAHEFYDLLIYGFRLQCRIVASPKEWFLQAGSLIFPVIISRPGMPMKTEFLVVKPILDPLCDFSHYHRTDVCVSVWMFYICYRVAP